jgi:hypothetical protein
VLLADDVGEALGPVAAVQGGGHPRTLTAPTDDEVGR